MTITFHQPPLNEVVLGYSFLPRPDLLIPHIGAFWREVQGDYPKVQHAEPIVDSPQAFSDGIPLPRVWLMNDDSGFLVQIQQDRLLVNWRDKDKGTPYVRFEAVRAEFARIESKFKDYIQRATGVPLVAARHNLTYVNLLPHGSGWTGVEDIERVFPSISWKRSTEFLPTPTELSLKAVFELPSGFGNLTVNVVPAKVVRDGSAVLKFELVARSGAKAPPPKFEEWVQVAHEWIVRGFKDLTSDEMHSKHWRLAEED